MTTTQPKSTASRTGFGERADTRTEAGHAPDSFGDTEMVVGRHDIEKLVFGRFATAAAPAQRHEVKA
jgi:hypothetical protein